VAEKETGWLTLIIVTLSVFIIVIDKTFMNVAIYPLIRDLHTNIGTIQSIIAIYSLILACLMILGSKLQNILGRRKTFISGAVIYGIGTIIAALSINSFMLLFGWSILEGIGAALMMPATTSIISGSYTGERRAFALGIISSMASGAGTIGPIIGGFLTTFYTWRYAFGLELVIIIVILLFSRVISVFPPYMKWSDIDIAGAIYSALGIFLFVLGILLLNNPKNWNIAPFLVISGIFLLIIFYLSENNRIKNNKVPLLDITLFRKPEFTLGNTARLLMNFTIGGVVFVIPVFVQGVLGVNPLTTGLALIPMSVGIFVMSFTAGKISSRVQARYIMSLGFLVAIAGSLYLIFNFNANTTIISMIPGILLLGIGMGIVFPHSANIIFSVAKHEQQPDASGVLNTGVNLGSALGTAVLGVILILGSFGSLAGGSTTLSAGNTSFHSNNSILEQFVQPNAQNTQINPTAKAPNNDLNTINAMKISFYVVIIILIIGLICSLLIPIQKKHPEHVKGEVPGEM